jgi:hypothetical protein
MDDFDLDQLDVPEPEYEIEQYQKDDDDDCAGGACKI